MKISNGPIPGFVFFNKLCGIPVLLFHELDSDLLEEYFRYLVKNKYESLNSDELYGLLKNNRDCYNLKNQRKIVITFDDGRPSNWTTVYPLAKKYNIKVVLFVIPERISHDYFISWDEAREMQQSGLIDIQSHSLKHELVFIDNRIIGFQTPHNIYLSLFLSKETKNIEQNYGAPIYSYTWRSLTDATYIEDEDLKNACINHVSEQGGAVFFKKNKWINQLFSVIKEYKKRHKLKDSFREILQSETELTESLSRSKRLIESSLNKNANHIALPLHKGNKIVYRAIKRAGFLSIYNGNDIKYNNNFSQDENGLYHIRRFQGYWIKSLPGEGRLSLFKRVLRRIAKFTK